MIHTESVTEIVQTNHRNDHREIVSAVLDTTGHVLSVMYVEPGVNKSNPCHGVTCVAGCAAPTSLQESNEACH